MEHTHPIDFLREVCSQEAHGEFLMRIIHIDLTKGKNLLPIHMEFFGIVAYESP